MESWMEFIASGSNNPVGSSLAPIGQNRKDYISRMQYPEYYKSDRTTITKFDRDYNREIEYTFIGLFPSAMSSIPVSYSSSEILKMSVNFEYDRYIAGKSLSFNEIIGNNNNNQINNNQINNNNQSNNQRVVYRTGSSLGESGVRGTIPNQGSVLPTILNN
jgi:hypothetical protein